MRDPKRIKSFLRRLEAVWNTVPDWRFGQLMCNTLGAAGRDPFFVEDNEMIEAIEKCMGQLAPGEIVNNHIEENLRPDGYMFGEDQQNGD